MTVITTCWTGRFGRALIRVTVVRWLAAELLALGCLTTGVTIAWFWRGAGAPLGFLVALLAGTILTTYYLYRVLGASAGWAIPLTLLLLAATILGNMVAGNGTVYDSAHPLGTHLVVTGTYWLALTALAGAIALTVAAAAASGEYWIRHHVPHGRWDAISRGRASLAGLWHPADPDSHR